MTDRGARPGGLYERVLGRAVSRARFLLEPEEEIEASAIVQRGVKPRYALVLIGLGAGLLAPALTSSDDLIPDAVRWYLGLPLLVAGMLLMAIPGQALLLLTAGTAYLVSRPPLPWLRPRLLADAPARALEVDLERGCATVAGHRLWAPGGRASLLRDLAIAAHGSVPAHAATGRLLAFRRRGALVAAVLGAAVVVALVLDAAIETDGEEIERVLNEYNDGLERGRGEEACGALTARAGRELVREATARLARAIEPPTCRRAVESLSDGLPAGGPNRRRGPPNILETEIEGDRASVRVGASFAYERIPFSRERDGWKLATVQAPAVVDDTPTDDPPTSADFAVRVEGTCQNSARDFVPAAARLVATPDPSADPRAAQPVAGLLRELSRVDEALADALSSLTPASATEDEVRRTIEALRRFAGARGDLADAVEAGDSDATAQAFRLVGRAQQTYRSAVSEAGLEIALGDCV